MEDQSGMAKRNTRDVRNWYGNILCDDNAPEVPLVAEDLAAILRDFIRYPGPVRPMGSRHSVTACMAAEVVGASAGARCFGTTIDLREMTGPLRLNKHAGTVTVPAGRLFVDVSRELRDLHNLQLPVITEFGSLTMGAAACGATKQSSFPGGYGQVGSYAVGMQLVTPDGTIHDLKEGDPDFECLRCSYGLFGIASELTFRVVPHHDISIRNEEMRLKDFVKGFERHSRRWREEEHSAVKLFMFPYADRVVAELRRKADIGDREQHPLSLALRNYLWRRGVPMMARLADRGGRPGVLGLELYQWLARKFLVYGLNLRRVSPVDTIVDFEKPSSRFTFSMWAFPAARFGEILPGYFEFCKRRQRTTGYRTDLLHMSYHIAKDTNSALSYSHDSDVWTLDPVSTGNDGAWDAFLRAFNEQCVAWGGVPLFNQTPHLKRRHVAAAFGDRLDKFEAARRRFDPHNRMLNDYFAKLLPEPRQSVHAPLEGTSFAPSSLEDVTERM